MTEIGYAFRDDPWKTLNFFSANSADSGLVDLFYIGSNTNGPEQVQADPNQTPEQKKLLKFLSKFPIIEEMESAQTGNLRQDKQIFKNGLITETWRAGAFCLSVYSTSPDSFMVSFYQPGDGQAAPDFPELNWITGNLFQGEQSMHDKQCYTYKLNDETGHLYL